MTATDTPPSGWRGFQIASPIYRSGPWLRDATGGWVAHHTLTAFGELHALCPRNGWWKLVGNPFVDPPEHVQIAAPGAAQDLNAWIADRVSHGVTPAVLEPTEPATFTNRDQAMAALAEYVDVQHVLATDTSERIAYDAQIIATAAIGSTIRTWALGQHDRQEGPIRFLVGLDRKDRPRFILAPLLAAEVDAE